MGSDPSTPIGTRADYDRVVKITSEEKYYPAADEWRMETDSWIGGHFTFFKAVEFGTFVCPDCSLKSGDPIVCYIDDHGDRPCPECGLLDTVPLPTHAPETVLDKEYHAEVARRRWALGQPWISPTKIVDPDDEEVPQ